MKLLYMCMYTTCTVHSFFRSEYESDGREFFSAWEPMCSPDGNFDKVQHNATRYSVKYCSDRDGVVIEDFWVGDQSNCSLF